MTPRVNARSGDRNQRIVECVKPEILDMQIAEMRLASVCEAHIDHQAHAQTAQNFVILAARRGANKQIIGDL